MQRLCSLLAQDTRSKSEEFELLALLGEPLNLLPTEAIFNLTYKDNTIFVPVPILVEVLARLGHYCTINSEKAEIIVLNSETARCQSIPDFTVDGKDIVAMMTVVAHKCGLWNVQAVQSKLPINPNQKETFKPNKYLIGARNVHRQAVAFGLDVKAPDWLPNDHASPAEAEKWGKALKDTVLNTNPKEILAKIGASPTPITLDEVNSFHIAQQVQHWTAILQAEGLNPSDNIAKLTTLCQKSDSGNALFSLWFANLKEKKWASQQGKS